MIHRSEYNQKPLVTFPSAAAFLAHHLEISYYVNFLGRLGKGGLKSESAGGFSIAIIDIPFYYPKLLHQLHDIDKMSILKKIIFTGSRSRFYELYQ